MVDISTLTDAELATLKASLGVDVISDTTGREMNTSLKLIAASQMVQARENLKSVTWHELNEFANDGLIGSVLDYGDMVNDTWKDLSVDPTVEYANPFHLAHIGDVELADGETLKNRPFFQTHYAQAYPVQFSVRAFYKCAEEGLTAGTYSIKMAQAWSKLTILQWTFTLTLDVPAGGRLEGFAFAADNSSEKRTIKAYAADGKTVLETVTATPGTDGTLLGTMPYSKREETGDNAKCNSMQEGFFGCNRWATSALRQYVNSDAAKNLWWTPQDEFDVAPELLATIPGWLSGCSEEFVSQLKKVKVATATNTVQFDDSLDYTYDRVFIPSLEQRFIVPQTTGEGAAFEYWKRRLNRSTPQKTGWNVDPLVESKAYSIKNHSEAVYERLRSAYRGYAYYVWYVGSGGYVYYDGARGAYCRFAPLVVI